jgi:carboxylesterase
MDDAVLMIHGLGGTQDEFGALPASFKKAGLTVHSLVLPGHGGQPEDLNDVVMEDWLDAVCKKYDEVMRLHQTVHLVGMCMGALLVCELAKLRAHTQGKLVLLAPTLYLDGWSMPWYHPLRALHYLVPMLRRRVRIPEEEPYGIKNERLRAIVKKRFERGDNFHYAWMPLQGIWQLDRLRHQVQLHLSSVVCETLIVHAREDEFSTMRSAFALQTGIGAARANVVILDNSFHMICIDNDKEIVTRVVLAFLGGENPHANTVAIP